MRLDNYINDLLYRYDCVIIPGFGGFVTNKIGAKVNDFTHTFSPPTKQITFNSHLKHNDGLLANYIVKAEEISFEEASLKIAGIVEKWNKELKSKSLKIGDIGSLSLNEKEQLIFEPNTTANFLTDAFGLATFASSAVKRSEYKGQVKSLTSDSELKEEERKGIPVFIKYAATAAILLTLGYTGWVGVQNQGEVSEEQKLQDKIQSATFVIDNPLPAIDLNLTKVTIKKFHVVAGAFQLRENAENKVNELKQKGFDSYILGENSWGLTQVVFDSYETKKEARKNLKEIQENFSKDAWLLVK
ncbi:SPOR domain-containing protein [Tenacibaculum maritimum]|uniref:HU domain-containing protein n=1 Tax=Tenacibaculum maritimum TaxID=107401 RepID=UPI0012E454F4|nr:SPOR domain-containing protein [Tenacibaculum maritimum]MCD9562399.1 SPOR domain-containing protein [Tenacibaculum maritimum]MCD9565700.1 SPOR domain-containing protein [Tenacibaculum maritimum]MCD9579381.1 SPOR domain-containing protein [Tenacibaculum maritimum]MCD9580723.1 SPOR domain-containing protein [Tenacibaculum maritimum]MCD9596297.1 SPOR domain-containing protein [Tenacibaculum maritimum]